MQLYRWKWDLSFDDNVNIIDQLNPIYKIETSNGKKHETISAFQKLIEYYHQS